MDDCAEKYGDRYVITGHRDGTLYGLHDEVVSVAGHKNGIVFGSNKHSNSINTLDLSDEFLMYFAGLQIVQDEIGKIVVKAVILKQGYEYMLETLQNKLENMLGENFEVEVETCDDYLLSKRGKFKFLIQNIDKY